MRKTRWHLSPSDDPLLSSPAAWVTSPRVVKGASVDCARLASLHVTCSPAVTSARHECSHPRLASLIIMIDQSAFLFLEVKLSGPAWVCHFSKCIKKRQRAKALRYTFHFPVCFFFKYMHSFKALLLWLPVISCFCFKMKYRLINVCFG